MFHFFYVWYKLLMYGKETSLPQNQFTYQKDQASLQSPTARAELL